MAAGASQPRRVLVLHGDRFRSCELLPGRAVVIGRSPSCDLVVAQSSLADQHARVQLDGELVIEDLDSDSGTWIGGERIPPRTRVAVPCGQEIHLGDATLVLLGPAEPSAPRVCVPETSSGNVVCDPRMAEIRRELRRFALGDLGILLLGETGVGKEILAEYVHKTSRRAGGPFLRVNCAAISTSLADSELFGHERGAFTGADQARAGLLEAASGGTVFLDEIGELPSELQAKLLRVLDERKVLRIGSREPVPIDVRFIAATNRDLPAEVARGDFREDLYYRLAGLVVAIPPLRQRPREIEPLAHRFVAAASRRLDRSRPPELSDEALAALVAHPWPGNVRELATVIERAVTRCGDRVEVADLQIDEQSIPARPVGRAAPMLDERQRIVAALEFASGNQGEAARLLGISRRTLSKRLDEYELPRPRKQRGR